MAGHDHCHSSHHYWGGEAGNLCHYQGTVNVKKKENLLAVVAAVMALIMVAGVPLPLSWTHGHWEWWLASTVMGLDKLMGCLPVVALMVLSSCHG